MTIDQGPLGNAPADVVELQRAASNQRHFILHNAKTLRTVLEWASEKGYYLCNFFATDERLQIDRTFKLYYVLSSGTQDEDEIVVLEYFVPNPEKGNYASVVDIFPNAAPLEQEIREMFGLVATGPDASPPADFLLHRRAYPADFYPLRRRRTLRALEERLAQFSPPDRLSQAPNDLPDGMLVVPVGPIHAGIIEAGHFPFCVAGEVVESLPVRLGYKHRGIEKLFETHYTLQDGWTLAEKVSGDSAVAHSVAYCQAVEDLAQVVLPPPVYQWRALFLELERIYNHISDMGLLAKGLSYERAKSYLATLRELFVRFVNQELSGNRFLRGLNYPGGVRAPKVSVLRQVYPYIEAIVEESLHWGQTLLEAPACRARMLTTGILTHDEARYATGLIARASGWIEHDFRLRHPSSAYTWHKIREHILETITPKDVPSSRLVPIYPHDLGGDVFARLAIRVAETETSLHLVNELVRELDETHHTNDEWSTLEKLGTQISKVASMSIGIGYTEGWRGDVMYVVFKGPGNTIARCKVRDPSTFNWQVFPKAVVRKPAEKGTGSWENILADFPLINKSFNLAYAGHDR